MFEFEWEYHQTDLTDDRRSESHHPESVAHGYQPVALKIHFRYV